MLDLFAIFTKGGIVLWCFQGTGLTITRAVNSLIKTVILQVVFFLFVVNTAIVLKNPFQFHVICP